MKKLLSVVVCIVMAVSMLAGCQSAQPTQAPSQAATGAPVSAAATQPAAEEPVTISIFGVDVRAIQGYVLKDNLWVWQELGKRLNLKFEFHTSNNYWDLIEPRLNSGQELEDLYALGYEDPGQFIEAGLFVQLDDLIASQGPNIAKVFEEDKNYRKHNTSLKDGKIYTLSETTYRCVLNDCLVYTGRKDWLDKLNLKAPKTIDELYNTCVAIRDGDPNGNGAKDEIPMVVDDYGSLRGFIGQSFGLHLIRNGGVWADNNGKVYNELTTDAYKETLMFVNKLYTEKLIPGDIQSMTWETADEYLKRNLIGLSWSGWAGLDTLLPRTKAIDPNADILTFYPPTGPDGTSVVELPYTQDCKRYAITKYCEKPEAAMKLLDYLYSDEGWLLYMYGIEGEDYTMVDGEPVIADKIAKAENMNGEFEKRGMRIQCVPIIYAPISQALQKARPASIADPIADIKDVAVPGFYLNKMPRTPEESNIVNNEDLETYIKETEMAFVLGTKPFSEWDAYQAKLVELGINDITAVYQAAYDRNYK